MKACEITKLTAELTSSFAVAMRPRDASYLSVVYVNSTIPRVQFFISYFCFGFTSTYNSIFDFWSVVFGVMSSLPSIHPSIDAFISRKCRHTHAIHGQP